MPCLESVPGLTFQRSRNQFYPADARQLAVLQYATIVVARRQILRLKCMESVMGLESASTKFVCAAKSLGVNFDRTLTIGRQTFFPTSDVLARVFSNQDIQLDADKFLAENEYSEEFFMQMGAREVSSMDFSSYENASIVHDLNQAIPDNLRGKFSVVYDGGTLEHVFSVTQAFKNCMEMVEVGGHFLQVNEANNFMGHGFWQFSPELMFRMFNAANGFEIESVLLHEVVPGGRWFEVKDPDSVRKRVELCNPYPVFILTIARRISEVGLFQDAPQQSDYVAVWDHHTAPTTNGGENMPTANLIRRRNSRMQAIKRMLPDSLLRTVWSTCQHLKSRDPFQRDYYSQLSEANLLNGEFGLRRNNFKRAAA